MLVSSKILDMNYYQPQPACNQCHKQVKQEVVQSVFLPHLSHLLSIIQEVSDARKEESYELGKQEGIMEIAKKMLNRNDSIEDIINLTNLSREEIASLKEKDC